MFFTIFYMFCVCCQVQKKKKILKKKKKMDLVRDYVLDDLGFKIRALQNALRKKRLLLLLFCNMTSPGSYSIPSTSMMQQTNQ